MIVRVRAPLLRTEATAFSDLKVFFSPGYTWGMAVRQFQLTPEAEPILDLVAASFGGDTGLALSELLIAHESIESFLDEMEGSNSAELIRQRERSARVFRDGLVVSWEQVKLDNGL